MTIVEMCVHMDCAGCETRVRKVLKRMEGVDEVDVDMINQKVTVTGWADQKKVLKAVRKTGRRAILWPQPTNSTQMSYHQAIPTQSVAVAGGYQMPHPAYGPGPASSYNYYKHGHDDSNAYYGYQQRIGVGSGFAEGTRTMFSDENPHACSIM